jgi:hypothetical protein
LPPMRDAHRNHSIAAFPMTVTISQSQLSRCREPTDQMGDFDACR